jgi:hypothetical protein
MPQNFAALRKEEGNVTVECLMPNQIKADYVDGSHDQIVEITICINADNITAGSTFSFHCVRSLPPLSSRASSCQEFQSLVSQPQRG